jgi:hypothetical protein
VGICAGGLGGDVAVVKAMVDAISLRSAGMAMAELGARESAIDASLMLLQSVRINDNRTP